MDKMALMDCTLLNKAGYNVFQRYFLTINEKKDKLKRADKNSDDLYVVASDLIGMTSSCVIPFSNSSLPILNSVGINNMWQIALDAKDIDVSHMAIRTLNELHQNVQLLFVVLPFK